MRKISIALYAAGTIGLAIYTFTTKETYPQRVYKVAIGVLIGAVCAGQLAKKEED